MPLLLEGEALNALAGSQVIVCVMGFWNSSFFSFFCSNVECVKLLLSSGGDHSRTDNCGR